MHEQAPSEIPAEGELTVETNPHKRSMESRDARRGELNVMIADAEKELTGLEQQKAAGAQVDRPIELLRGSIEDFQREIADLSQ